MKFRFEADRDHLVVRAIVIGSHEVHVKAVIDTGANTLVVVPSLAESLKLPKLSKTSVVSTLNEDYQVSRVCIPKLVALGYEFKDMEAVVFGLSDKMGAEMLIGLKFLRKFSDLHVNFKKAYIELTH